MNSLRREIGVVGNGYSIGRAFKAIGLQSDGTGSLTHTLTGNS